MNDLPEASEHWKVDRRTALALLALPGAWLGTNRKGQAAGGAGDGGSKCCGLQEFWVVDTRCAPTCCGLADGVDRIAFSKKNGRRIDRGAFLAAIEGPLPVVLYVHGNSLNAREAIAAGERLVDGIGPNVPGYRFVLWSWPSERVAGLSPAENVRIKAPRSETQGFYLAWLIDQIDRQTPLGLVGYSLGARTVTAALDGLASGDVAGHRLAERDDAERRPMQAALLAPAEDNTWLLPGRRHGLALTQVDRVLVTVNSRDRILRHFTRLARGDALGTRGIASPFRLGELRPKVREVVVTPWVGTAHRWLRYTQSEEVMSRLRPYLFEFDIAARDPTTL